MKAIHTIAFLCFVIIQTYAQNSINVEAIRYYIANNPPKENERLVNEMYSQKERMGIESFDSMKIQILYEIAHQCPDIGGTAVYRARSIYALIEFDTYDDDCDNLAQAKSGNIFHQDSCIAKVNFLNPSLEDTPHYEKVPLGWDMCIGTPNVEPFFSYAIPPSDGNSYVSFHMWNSQNGETFGQELSDTLFANKQYGFLFDLATPPVTPSTFSSMVIWLGDSSCKRQQLIYTLTTSDTSWHTYPVIFKPNNNYTYISFEEQNWSGNFIDNLRPIPQPLCDSISSITPVLPDKTADTGNDVYTNITTTVSSEFKIYPNPNTQGQLMVEWTNPIQHGKLVLVDALGKVIKQYIVDDNVVSQQIDIQALPSGYYTILLETNRQVIGREKLIVIKQ